MKCYCERETLSDHPNLCSGCEQFWVDCCCVPLIVAEATEWFIDKYRDALRELA